MVEMLIAVLGAYVCGLVVLSALFLDPEGT